MDSKIVERLNKPVEPRTRKGKGGVTFSYVTGTSVVDALNEAFEYEWSSEVMETTKEDGYVITRVRISVNLKNPDGSTSTVYKEAFGGAEIKKRSSDGSYLDLSNDYKTAMTSALKKAAEQFGIALHLDEYANDYSNEKKHSPAVYQKPTTTYTSSKPTPTMITDTHNPKATGSVVIKAKKPEETTNNENMAAAKKMLAEMSAPAPAPTLAATAPVEVSAPTVEDPESDRPKEFPKTTGTTSDIVNDMQVSAIRQLCVKAGVSLEEALTEAIKFGGVDKNCLGKPAEEFSKAQAISLIKYLVSPKTAE